MMLGQVGLWDDKLAVGWGDEMLAWLDARTCGKRPVYVSVRTDRTVVVAAALESEHHVFSAPGNGLKYHCHIKLEHFPHIPGMDMPRFGLHRIDFEEHGDELHAVLPPDHELSWPKLTDCKAYTLDEVLAVDVHKRVLSALRCGSKNLGAPMSDHLRKRISTKVWGDAMSRARDDHAAEVRAARLAA